MTGLRPIRPGRYRMRNGNEAQVWEKNGGGNPLYPYYGSLPESPEEDGWDGHGKSWSDARFDLIERVGPLLPRPAKASLPPQSPLGATGWQMVPVEPTEAMKKAGFDPFIAAHDPFFNQNEPTAPIYRAMLAAAPAAPIDRPGADRAGIIEECAKIADAAVIAAERIGTRGLRLSRKHEARRIAAAIRSLSPKEPT